MLWGPAKMSSYPKTVLTFTVKVVFWSSLWCLYQTTHTHNSETFGISIFFLFYSGLRTKWEPVCVSECPLCTRAEEQKLTPSHCACWATYTEPHAHTHMPSSWTCRPTHIATWGTNTHARAHKHTHITMNMLNTDWLKKKNLLYWTFFMLLNPCMHLFGE